jgi:hypothetical protein
MPQSFSPYLLMFNEETLAFSQWFLQIYSAICLPFSGPRAKFHLQVSQAFTDTTIIIFAACDFLHHNTDRAFLRTLQLFSHSFETHDLQVALARLCDYAKRCSPIQFRPKHC